MHDEGDTERLLVHRRSLLNHAVCAQALAVVGQHDHDRVIGQPLGVQVVQHSADFGVNVRHEPVVVRDQAAPVGLSHVADPLVLDGFAQRAGLGGEVVGQRDRQVDFVRRHQVGKVTRRDDGRMRVLDRAAERPGALVARVKKFDGLVHGPRGTGVLDRDGRCSRREDAGSQRVRSTEAAVLALKGLGQPVPFQVLDVEIAAILPVAVGAPEVGPAVMRGFVVAHVPGAGVAHAVAGGLEGLAQRGHGFRERRAMDQRTDLRLPIGRELRRIANPVHAVLVRVASGEHGRASRGALRKRHVGAGEPEAIGRQPVKYGRTRRPAAVGPERAPLQLVHQHDHDVGSTRRHWPLPESAPTDAQPARPSASTQPEPFGALRRLRPRSAGGQDVWHGHTHVVPCHTGGKSRGAVGTGGVGMRGPRSPLGVSHLHCGADRC